MVCLIDFVFQFYSCSCPGARWEELSSLPLYCVVCTVAEQLAHILALRLRKNGHLDEQDQAMAATTSRVRDRCKEFMFPS